MYEVVFKNRATILLSDGHCDAYNYYVTETHDNCSCNSQRCPAGCVAVAVAQIMKYWNYPVYLPNQTYQ